MNGVKLLDNIWKCKGYEYEMVNLPFSDDNVLCVECFTYNQAGMIKDALDSFLMQETNFEFSIFVIDDASCDGTREVLLEYAKRYRDRIGLLLAKENTFYKPVRQIIYREARKCFMEKIEYIATCEGDDFWTDKNKLQIQFDYLNTHPECAMYLHNSWWFDCRSGEKKEANPFECDGERDLDIRELIYVKNRYPATASRVYRNAFRLNAPDFVFNCPVGDYSLYTYAGAISKVHYSNRIMCTYRYMSGNSTSDILADKTKSSYLFYHDMGLASYLLQLDGYTHYKYHFFIKKKVVQFLIGIAEELGRIGKTENDVYEMMAPFKLNMPVAVEKELLEMIRQLSDEVFINENLRKYIDKHKDFLVFGTGVYSKKLLKQLENNGIHPIGFIKTKVEKENSFLNKPLWSINDIPEDLKNVGVVVSVIPKCDDDIDEAFRKVGITDYFYAYELA